MYRSFVTLLGLAALVAAKSIDIDVGENGGFKFSPNTVTAAVGDTLEFHFYSGSGGHSVVSSSFDSPCVPGPGAFFSGYIPGNDSGDTTFVVDVTSTDPIWFYCSLQKHCQNGMVGVVNPPSGKTIQDYSNAAQAVAAASAPGGLTGGVLTTIEDSSSTTASSSGSSATSGGSSATSTPATTTGGSTTASTTGTGGAASTASSKASAASSSGASATSSKASAASSAASSAATTPPAATGDATHNGAKPVMLGLGVVLGGMVAMMA